MDTSFYDQMIAVYASSHDPLYRLLAPILDMAQVFKIDNVATYYMQSKKDVWFPDDFPNVAPPFEIFWMEFGMPARVHVDGHYENTSGMIGTRFGALWMAQRTQEPETAAAWRVIVDIFISRRTGGTPKPLTRFKININAEGQVVPDNQGSFTVSVYPDTMASLDALDTAERQRAIGSMAANYLYPFLLAISFLHCKNVTLRENLPPALPKTKKRQHQVPRHKFYTLDIKPMQRVLAEEGRSGETGLKVALHVCRGHFKEFGGEHGLLFGKYEGTYWWESQVRGTKAAGEVTKDYRVSVPADAAGQPATR